MNLQWFRVPRDIVFGSGTLEYLKQVQGNKAFICTGKNSMQANGVLDRAIGYLKEAGIESLVFNGVEGDPSLETVQRGAEIMKEFAPNLIIGIGGCSAIDAAKAMWVLYEYPGKTFYDIKAPFSIPELRKRAKFIAIPSTSGTGTEVTCVAVITEADGIKHPLASYEITPDIAILDPEICVSMPPHVTADTGVDALSHSFEAYVSTMANDYTDLLVLKSIKNIFQWLPKAYQNGQDINARTKMHISQNFAGMAFSNAILGIDHSLSHKISTKAGTTHGRCNTILMPAVIQYNSKVAGERYAQIGQYLGLSGSSEQELINALVTAIRQLNASLGIQPTLQSLGMPEDVFLSNVEQLAEAALGDPCTGTNPRKPTVAGLVAVYKAAYYGTDVTI
ncbi:alcohol dehydrogenase, class IV [Desulfosporosinus orientis DSM 765]|uniref:Alcohol dehydrogenase, class IV n=1 Tax=Desulfosporosinus orientis (strain ATCC 19365 / DSM 765 / NCIMB 8382 / VKM B-1628 / Singapore I) TaxID=768706 RepID=G7WH29_DESOD|nr:iron-containing alcohol dehydrogenase [Desulfosporosinus orientis]AET69537.1 alcohol dehydrogenase, class IV [Desulfosporosinus orientis DSM 765]